MKFKALILITLWAALLLGGCAAQPSANQQTTNTDNTANTTVSNDTAYHKIDAATAKEMLAAGDVTLVDVRTPAEYNETHIPGAINIPVESIGNEKPALLPNQNDKIMVYCRTGIRSRNAANQLVALGYTQIYDLGGIRDWPYETESGEN